MKYQYVKGSTSVIIPVFIQDSSSTTGAGLAGLDESSSIVGGYVRPGEVGLALAVDQNVTTEGTYEAPSTDNQIRIGTPANMRAGTYELHLHNDLVAAGADSVFITLGGATDMADLVIEIQLTGFDLNSPGLSDVAWGALEDQFDGTGLVGDVFPLRQDQGASISGGLAVRETATSVTTISGSEQDLANASASNGTHWTGDDDGAGAEFIFRFVPSDTDASPGDLHFEGFYAEPGGPFNNSATLETYNFENAQWDIQETLTNSATDELHDNALSTAYSSPGSDTIEGVAVTIGDVLVKFQQTSQETGNAALNIDQITVGFISSPLTASEIVDEWETQSQADPTGFQVNQMEVNGTAQTANDNGADINELQGVLSAGILARSNNPTLNALLGVDDAAAKTIGHTIWDKVLSKANHDITQSAAKLLRQLASFVIANNDARVTGSPGINQIQLAASESSVDGTFDPGIVGIIDGTGAGQCRLILEYDGTSKIATLNRDWKVAPDATSEYVILCSEGGLHVNEGLAQGGGVSSITLNLLASTTNDVYNGQFVFLVSGTGQDQVGRVTAYNGTSKVATIVTTMNGWAVQPDATTGYIMIPILDTVPTLLGTPIALDGAAATLAAMLTKLADDNSGADFDATTDSQQAIRDRGDAAWPTATGFNTVVPPSVAQFNARTILAASYATASALAAVAADLPVNPTKNVALANFPFPMVLSSDHVTGATGLTVVCQRAIDGGAFANCANTPATEMANGWYKISLDASDMNGDTIALKFTAATADSRSITITTQPT